MIVLVTPDDAQMKHVLEMSLKESKENSAQTANEDEELQRAIDARYGNQLKRETFWNIIQLQM